MQHICQFGKGIKIGPRYAVIIIRIKWQIPNEIHLGSTSQIEGFLLDNYPSKNLLRKDQSQTSNIQTMMTWNNLQQENAPLSLHILLTPHVCIASEKPAITLSE